MSLKIVNQRNEETEKDGKLWNIFHESPLDDVLGIKSLVKYFINLWLWRNSSRSIWTFKQTFFIWDLKHVKIPPPNFFPPSAACAILQHFLGVLGAFPKTFPRKCISLFLFVCDDRRQGSIYENCRRRRNVGKKVSWKNLRQRFRHQRRSVTRFIHKLSLMY